MDFEQKREFMKMCENLSVSAEKFKEDLERYRLEVMVGVIKLAKQRELMVMTSFRTVVNILSKCDLLMRSVGHADFQKLQCYNQLIKFIEINNKPFAQSTEITCNKSQADTVFENLRDGSDSCAVSITVKEEMIDGYDSEETVLIDRDTNLKDVMEEVEVSHSENNRGDFYLRVPTPTKSYSSCSTEDGSYIFNLKLEETDPSCPSTEHSNNLLLTGRSVQNNEGTIPFAPSSGTVLNTTNNEEKENSVNNIEATVPEVNTGDSNSEVSIKNESIFEKSTQMLDSDAETDIEENLSEKIVREAQKSPRPTAETTGSPHLQLCVEHESDYEEDDDFYQLNVADSKSSSLSDSELEDFLDIDSNKSDIFLEKDDSDECNQEISEEEFADDKLQKKCVVNITRLPQKVIDKFSSKTVNISDFKRDNSEVKENHLEDPEDYLTRLKKDIERLTDLNTLKRRKKRNKKYESSKHFKKLKINGTAGDKQSEEDEESTSTSESSNESDSSMTINREKSILKTFPMGGDMQYDILSYEKGISESETDNSEIYSESSAESEAESTKKHGEKNDRQKENSKETKVCSTAPKKKIAEWRKDSLLRGKLISESSSSEDCDIPKVRSTRRKKRVISSEPETVEEKLPVEDKVKQENFIKDDTEETKTAFTNSAPLYEVTDILSPSSESNSDVEFVCPSNQKNNDLYVNNDDENISSDDVEFVEENQLGKPGRKNIRKVLDDVNLGEDTKKANKEEEAQRQRLLKKKKELETWSQTSESSQVEGLVLDLNQTTKQAVITVDPILTARLKKHQIEGVRFMWDICYESVERLKKSPGTGCILAHCMGLGKTYQVIVLIHTLFRHRVTNTNYVLILCPLSIVMNWVHEFEWGLKNVKEKVNVFYLMKKNSEKLKVLNRWRKNKGVLIMGYEAFERLVRSESQEIIEALVDPGPDLAVCDEGHLIKNIHTLRSKAVNRIKTRRRIMLTGTPIQNSLVEYYYMVSFVKPNLLGTYNEYTNRFVHPITNGQYHDSTQHDIKIMKQRSHVLHKLLRSTVQRYEASELEKQIPKRLDYAIFIKSHPLQANLYKQYIQSMPTLVGKRILVHYHRLQAILSHPLVLDLKEKNSKNTEQKEIEVIDLEPEIKENEPLPSGWWRTFCPDDYKDNLDYGPKLKVMLKIVDECEKIGDKLLIFSNSMPEMDAIEYNLRKRTIDNRTWKKGVEFYRMDGQVLPEDRNNICDSFNNPNNTKAKVLLISYKVGGLGLNMVAANRVILMDVNWNPSFETQSIFRVYRFGQVKECFIYRLISMGTFEEVIYKRCVTKLSAAIRVLDKRQITRHYKCAQLQEMLSFNLNLEETRPTPKPPSDKLLAKLLLELETEIFKYHEHQALLENRPDEELNEEEMKLAWEEYHQEQLREIEGRRIEPVPPPNVTNALFEQNIRMEELNLANSSHAMYYMDHGTNESTGLNQANIPSYNKVGMETATSSEHTPRQIKRSMLFENRAAPQFKKPAPKILTKPKNFRKMLLKNDFANTLQLKDTPNPFARNQINNSGLRPFLPSPNYVPTSSSNKTTLQQQQQYNRTQSGTVILNGRNYTTEGGQLRNPLQKNVAAVEQEQDHTEMVQSLKKEYSRLLQNPENHTTGFDKCTEIMTPVIQSVYSEAPQNNNGQVSSVNDVMKRISHNPSITLLPMDDGKNQSNRDDVIEIP